MGLESVAAQLILISFTAFIIYNANPGSSLFSWHPTFMVSSFFLQTEGVLLYKYPRPENRVAIHWAIQASSLTAQFLGFFAIYNNKENNNVQHFTTYHGLIGLLTFGFTIMQSVGGNIAKFSPYLKNFIKASKVKRGHRLFGMVVLGLLYTTIHLAMHSTWVGGFLPKFGMLWFLAVSLLPLPLFYGYKGITINWNNFKQETIGTQNTLQVLLYRAVTVTKTFKSYHCFHLLFYN